MRGQFRPELGGQFDQILLYPPDPAFYMGNGSMGGGGVYPVICFLARINETNSANDPIVW